MKLPFSPSALSANLATARAATAETDAAIERYIHAAAAPRPEILFHPQIPKPLHGLAPRTILGQVWWDELRQAAYRATGYHCAACWIPKAEALYHPWLEAHELYTIDYAAGTMEMVEIVALCPSCHGYIHKGRLEMMVRDGRSTKAKHRQILAHGERVLAEAAPDRTLRPRKIAPWPKWRLLLDGKAYPSKFADQEAWAEHYRDGGS